jgi:hypothetical protein
MALESHSNDAEVMKHARNALGVLGAKKGTSQVT